VWVCLGERTTQDDESLKLEALVRDGPRCRCKSLTASFSVYSRSVDDQPSHLHPTDWSSKPPQAITSSHDRFVVVRISLMAAKGPTMKLLNSLFPQFFFLFLFHFSDKLLGPVTLSS
jgi:hypothetical protein